MGKFYFPLKLFKWRALKNFGKLADEIVITFFRIKNQEVDLILLFSPDIGFNEME
ncbi:hypothetical protein [Chryseobacterium sp.]|uniref:hypothetical protein n=1 Tax=Chryseobacterium sp. TaxID=1871047 RepID=UPI001B0D8843|nr:hypothetical protein [Chryseobacterium sp.]MBO9690519.1 hypothetical protein [Chryseobacterium sp.]